MFVGASLALIFLVIQMILATLVVLVVIVALVYGMHKLRQVIVRFLPKAQAFTQQVADVTHQVSNKVAAPFLWANGAAAHVQQSAKAARRRMTR